MTTNNSPLEMIYLLKQQTSNITTDPIKMNFSSPEVSLQIWGTWDGASVSLEVSTVPSIDSVTSWITIRDWSNTFVSFEYDQTVTLKEYIKGQSIRAVLTNAGANTSINCTLQAIY